VQIEHDIAAVARSVAQRLHAARRAVQDRRALNQLRHRDRHRLHRRKTSLHALQNLFREMLWIGCLVHSFQAPAAEMIV
jgi:hypothetical protein